MTVMAVYNRPHLLKVYHNLVRVHDGVEAMSNGNHCAVGKLVANCLLNHFIRPVMLIVPLQFNTHNNIVSTHL